MEFKFSFIVKNTSRKDARLNDKVGQAKSQKIELKQFDACNIFYIKNRTFYTLFISSLILCAFAPLREIS